MNRIIHELTSHVKKNNYQIITISECGHGSYDSHTIHYELMKNLFENKLITSVSSERLGFISALVLEKYIQNKIKYNLKNLVEMLGWVGMGTYRWIKYFRKNKSKINIYGLEPDYSITDALLPIIKEIGGNDLYQYLQQNWNDVKEYKLKPKFKAVTREDSLIMKSFLGRYNDEKAKKTVQYKI